MGMMTRRNVKQRAVVKTAPVVKDVKNDYFSKYMNPPVDNEYTKTDINRMSTADLKKLAVSNEISDAEEMNGAELKKVLIEKFGL